MLAFLSSTAKPFVIPSPSFWIVDIDGVGAVYEYPKNVRVGLVFHIESAIRRIPRGHGWFVALYAMVVACGLFLKRNGGVFIVLCKKCRMIGPNRPNESIAKGSKIMLLASRSPMTSSPMIVVGEVSSSSVLSLRVNFLCSSVCRCESARAVTEVTSTDFEEGIFAHEFPMVMSMPIVVYGQ